MNWINHHLHTHYSLLDASITPEELVSELVNRNCSHVTVTEHGTLASSYKIWKLCDDADITPILGCECYFIDNYVCNDFEIPYSYGHVVVLAQNLIGWNNLKQLQLIAWEKGYLRKPRISLDDLMEYNKGLIITTGCLRGLVGGIYFGGEKSYLDTELKGRRKFIRQRIKRLKKVFGNRLYAEVQLNDLEDQNILNKYVLKLADKYSLPIIVTGDTHYINKEDSHVHDAILCIKYKTQLNDEDNKTYSSKQFWYKDFKELNSSRKKWHKDITKEQLKKFCKETIKLANRIERYPIKPESSSLPIFSKNPEKKIRKICKKHLDWKLVDDNIIYDNRLEHEISIIKDLGYLDYFLVVWDIVEYCKKNNITWNARGSVCGSLVAYFLGITWIDPIKFDTTFERFLTEDRLTLPDIDMDFGRIHRETIIEYLEERYGTDSVAHISNYTKWKPRGVIKDVGRILGHNFQSINAITQKIPHDYDWDDLYKIPEVTEFLSNNEDIDNLGSGLMKINRQWGVHASGIVITPGSIVDWTPISYTTQKEGEENKKIKITEWDMYVLEEANILKLDVLGQNNLDIIDDTLVMLEQNGATNKFSNYPEFMYYIINHLRNKKVYDLLRKGNNVGLFQIGTSEGMIDLCRKLKPTCLDDIQALISLHRTAVLRAGMHIEYVERKFGGDYEYLHPKMAGVLESTYGVLLFQEQVGKLAEVLAGFTATEADNFRKGIKAKDLQAIKKWKNKFIDGCKSSSKIKRKIAKEIWGFMEYFAGYGFNKSHSAAYAIISYAEAYLKCYFPKEFMTALLTRNMDDDDKLNVYLKECRRLNIKCYLPDINKSSSGFKLINTGIVYPLSVIKQVGDKAVENILGERNNKKFKNFEDFYNRINKRVVNIGVITNLIFGKSLRRFGKVEKIYDEFMELRGIDKVIRQLYCYSCTKRYPVTITTKDLAEKGVVCPKCGDSAVETDVEKCVGKVFDKAFILSRVYGFSVAENKLKKYAPKIAKERCETILGLDEIEEGQVIKIAFEVTKIKLYIDKNGNEMAFLDVSDNTLDCSLTVFANNWEELKESTYIGNCYIGELTKNRGNNLLLNSYLHNYMNILK